jgi:hypothetical protein
LENDLRKYMNTSEAQVEMENLMHVKNPGMQGLGACLNTFTLAAVEKEGYFMAAILALGVTEEGAKSPDRKQVEQVLSIVQ